MKQFEYMDEYYLEPNQSYSGKFMKVVEEYGELKESVENCGTHSATAQEILDLILSSINLLKKMNDEELIDIGTETFKHSVKLKPILRNG